MEQLSLKCLKVKSYKVLLRHDLNASHNWSCSDVQQTLSAPLIPWLSFYPSTSAQQGLSALPLPNLFSKRNTDALGSVSAFHVRPPPLSLLCSHVCIYNAKAIPFVDVRPNFLVTASFCYAPQTSHIVPLQQFQENRPGGIMTQARHRRHWGLLPRCILSNRKGKCRVPILLFGVILDPKILHFVNNLSELLNYYFISSVVFLPLGEGGRKANIFP